MRFVGEPIWPERTAAETAEATQHEALINLAFAESTASILCPYDLHQLPPAVIADSGRTHPELIEHGTGYASAQFTDPLVVCGAAAWPLPTAPADAEVLQFGADQLGVVRRHVRDQASPYLRAEGVEDLVLAANEVVTNTLVHGAGSGQLRIWREPQSLVCEVSERGRILDPLAGRHPAPSDARGGRGLLLTHQLCDLVETRTDEHGTTTRLHVAH